MANKLILLFSCTLSLNSFLDCIYKNKLKTYSRYTNVNTNINGNINSSLGSYLAGLLPSSYLSYTRPKSRLVNTQPMFIQKNK